MRENQDSALGGGISETGNDVVSGRGGAGRGRGDGGVVLQVSVDSAAVCVADRGRCDVSLRHWSVSSAIRSHCRRSRLTRR